MNRVHLALMSAILLAAFALRVVGVAGESPPGVAHDEVANWLIDRSILDEGNHALYFTRAYGHEAGFHYLQAAVIALVGDNLLALRLPAAFAGLWGVAVAFALARRLFGMQAALLAAGLLAVLFWPVFYGRLGLRAISLPLVAGLSAVCWWLGWQSSPGQKGGQRFWPLAGLFAGLSLYTYLAARALPLFYGFFVAYLALAHRPALKARWRGLALFTAVFTLTALPLFIYLQANPGAEFRVAEVSQPLTDLRHGDPRPVLANGLKLAGMFGFTGDPLWREGVPGVPVFEPLLAILFYGGVVLAARRWRDGRYAFILLWLLISLIPSLVTINAPSHIRSLNALVVMTTFPAIFIHKLSQLSTVFPRLSTKTRKLALTFAGFMFFSLYAVRTVHLLFTIWPTGGEVPFVWQTALAEAAAIVEASAETAVALAGWSPETMDSPTMTLLRQNDTVPISHFNPEEGTLLIPPSLYLVRPAGLPLHPDWEARLAQWGAAITPGDHIVEYRLPQAPALNPAVAANVQFGDGLRFLGYETTEASLLTYWQVTAVPPAARRLFVHFLDEEGNQLADTYAFDTADPQALWFPHWQPGDLLLQRHELPPEAAAAQIRLGWFDPYTCMPGPCQNLLTDTGQPFLLLPLPD